MHSPSTSSYSFTPLSAPHYFPAHYYPGPILLPHSAYYSCHNSVNSYNSPQYPSLIKAILSKNVLCRNALISYNTLRPVRRLRWILLECELVTFIHIHGAAAHHSIATSQVVNCINVYASSQPEMNPELERE